MKRASSAPPSQLTVTTKKATPRAQRLGGFDLQQIEGGGFRLRLDIVTSLGQAMEILALLQSDTRPDDRQVS